jgi:hypothetical protein
MDIRVINKAKEIVNVSRLSITTQGKWLIGLTERGETVRIEEYESKEEAQDRLEAFGMKIEAAMENKQENVLIKT